MQYLHPQGQVERRPQFQWNEKALLNKVHKLIYIERERERERHRERESGWVGKSAFVFAIKIKLKNLLKMTLSYQKSSFCPQDFRIFISFSPLLSFLGCWWFYRRGWVMISSKVYDIILFLNWILKAYII